MNKSRLATVLSNLFSPFFACGYMLLLIFVHENHSEQTIAGLVFLTLQMILIPALIILGFFRKDKLLSIDFRQPQQRVTAYTILSLCAFAGFVTCYLFGFYHYMIVPITGLIVFLTAAFISHYDRLSPHICATTAALLLTQHLTHNLILCGAWLLILGLLGWARIQLKINTLPQILYSLLLGLLAGAVALLLYG